MLFKKENLIKVKNYIAVFKTLIVISQYTPYFFFMPIHNSIPRDQQADSSCHTFSFVCLLCVLKTMKAALISCYNLSAGLLLLWTSCQGQLVK